MYIVYCSDNPVFMNDSLQDKSWSSKFPGAGWITCLYEIAKKNNIKVASADVALKAIEQKKWEVSDIYLIDEMYSTIGCQLLKLGCKPFAIVCGESSLYAADFYDNIEKCSKHFSVRLGFGFKSTSKIDLCEPFRFPSYYLDDLEIVGRWSDRKKLVFIASNKYLSNKFFLALPFKLLNFFRQLKTQFKNISSFSFCEALECSLLDKRLEAIAYFLGQSSIEIYGSNWNDLSNLPAVWSKRNFTNLSKAYLGLCDNKIKTLSKYKFNICFENIAQDYYVTEKIIDCFVAGTIPIYLGAPNIREIIPHEAFINLRDFKTLDDLDAYLNAITESQAIDMINAGRVYLNSKKGRLHSYEQFAENIIEVVNQC